MPSMDVTRLLHWCGIRYNIDEFILDSGEGRMKTNGKKDNDIECRSWGREGR